MLHIFLVILKIIGILLLILIGLLIITVFAFLFVPVRYRVGFVLARSEGCQEIDIRAVASFMGPFLRFKAEYGKGFSWRLMLFGLTLLSGKRSSARDNALERLRVIDLSDEDADSEDEDFSFEDNEEAGEANIDADDDLSDSGGLRGKFSLWQRINNLTERICLLIKRIKLFFLNLNESFRRFAGRCNEIRMLFNDERFMEAYRFIKRRIQFVLKKVMPHIEILNLRFGTEDPALTGKLLGAVAVLRGFTGQRIEAEADFYADKIYVEGDGSIKGKLRLIHLLTLLYQYMYNSEVKYFKHKITLLRRKI